MSNEPEELETMEAQLRNLEEEVRKYRALVEEKKILIAEKKCPFKRGERIKRKGDRNIWSIVRILYHPLYHWELEMTIGGRGSIVRIPSELEAFSVYRPKEKAFPSSTT